VFGSIGGPEVILLFIAALLLFGPRRLPEIGRTLGKAMAEFRKATTEFRTNLEREVRMDELKGALGPIDLAPRPDTLARGLLDEVTRPLPPASPAVTPAATEPAAVADSAAPAPSADTPAIDGGPGSVH
jgi:Tat protein translocase TatB subunit